MLKSILKLLEAVPKIIELLNRTAAAIDEKRLNEWLESLESAVVLTEKAKTNEDRANAAKAWADVLSSMRKSPK